MKLSRLAYSYPSLGLANLLFVKTSTLSYWKTFDSQEKKRINLNIFNLNSYWLNVQNSKNEFRFKLRA